MAAPKKKKAPKKAAKTSAKAARRKIAAPKKAVKKAKAATKKRAHAKHRHVEIPSSVLSLGRHVENPILSPVGHSYWESKAVFNPSAVYGDGKIHLIYRAIGHGDMSVFGYAVSSDGLNIEKRGKHPAFVERIHRFSGDRHLTPKILYESGGGGNGGAEDPRLTLIDGRVYMLYTSFDGWSSVRIAITSISFEDFVREKWNWKKPVLISPPGEIHKNWVIFPEKIKGKFAMLQGISPRVQIRYLDTLDHFDGSQHLESERPNGKGFVGSWDNKLRGVGPTPIRTKYGWLVIYHAMDERDPNRYKLGAMLLDLKDPNRILVRSHKPILEPDEWYENEGMKSGVVYSCGAIVVDEWLYVYYGGADTVACVATAHLDTFLRDLMSNGSTKIIRAGSSKK